MPDYEHDVYYLEVCRGIENSTYIRKTIHHDFFHIIDYRDDGNLYKDERWVASNPASFKYGNGGKNAQDIASTSVLTDKYPGFLNRYSTTGVEEDNAEIFANRLFDFHSVEDRTKKDPVLKAKVLGMRELLVGFCPEMAVSLWEQVQSRE